MPLVLTGSSCDDCERLFYRRKPNVDWRNARRVTDSAGLLASMPAPSMATIHGEISRSWILRELPRPLNILVDDRAKSRANELACIQTASRLPPDSLIGLGDGVYMCSPEFRFLRSARATRLPAQLVYGMGLCGAYLMDAESEDGFVECAPRTSPQLMRRYLDNCEGAHGVKQARVALKFLRANARSPMESTITVILVLPARRGGYGLEGIELNVPIEIGTGPAWKRGGGTLERVADIYFPDINLDLEYNGRLRHTGDDRVRSDDQRRVLLENAGVTVITLCYEDASNVSTMNKTVERIKKIRGLRCTVPSRGVLEKRNALFASIMPGSVVECRPAVEIASWKTYQRAVAKRSA